MNTLNKTFKYISALTLILLLSSIVLPASMSAASLFCKMEMATMNRGAHTCCDFHKAGSAQHNEATVKSDKKSCTGQKICTHIISREQADVEATLQLFREFDAVFVYEYLPDKLVGFQHSKSHQGEFTAPDTHPPLFLLNSAFLN